MRITIQTQETAPAADIDIIIGFVAEDRPAGWLQDYVSVQNLTGLADVRGIRDEATVLYNREGAIPRFFLLGIGKQDESQWQDRAQRLALIRTMLGSAIRRVRNMRLSHVGFAVSSLAALDLSGESLKECLEEVVYAAQIGLYAYDACKSEKKNEPGPESFTVLQSGNEFEADFTRSVAEAEAVAFARDLVNAPANILPPMALAAKAREAAGTLPLACRVLGREELEKEGLRTLLAVSGGSNHEPALVCLEYTPEGKEQDVPLVLVGKGLTFDSGGISLKPSLGMHEMKSDMAGAAVVFAVMRMIATLGAQRRVVGLMPCAENMPDAGASRPGDVVTTLDGKTVEIINTDAEGRLVLCDALTWAQEQYKPAAMVDIATLTGACVVALGSETAGLFSDDDVLATQLADAGCLVGERFWRLPLWDSYAEGLKSPTADLANVGSREGGAITAAVFLKQFVSKEVAWAHLDIAGTAYKGKKSGDAVGGATGFGVRTLAALALSPEK